MISGLGIAASLLACESDNTESTAATTEEKPNSIAIGIPTDIQQPVRSLITSITEGMVAPLFYPTLFNPSVESGSLSYEPSLGKDWQFSPDNTQMTVTLDERYKWNNGQAVTADDVVFGVTVANDPLSKSSLATKFDDITATAVSEVVVDFTASKPMNADAFIARVAGLSALPAEALRNIPYDQIGNTLLNINHWSYGPFQIDQHKHNEVLIASRNPHHPASANLAPEKIDRAVFKVLPDSTALAVEFEMGSIQAITSVTPHNVDRFEKMGAKRINYPKNNLAAFIFNHVDYASCKDTISTSLDKCKPHPIFGDADVRKAVVMGINSQKIMEHVFPQSMWNSIEYAFGFVPSAFSGYYNPALKPVPQDLPGAATLLMKAGWMDHDGDGVRDKDDKPLEFSTLIRSGETIYEGMAVMIQAQLKTLGIKVNVEPVASNQFVSRALIQHDFDTLVHPGLPISMDPDGINWYTTYSDSNIACYNNPRVNALNKKATDTADKTLSQGNFREIQQSLQDDAFAAPLYWHSGYIMVSDRVSGTSEKPQFAPLSGMENWDLK